LANLKPGSSIAFGPDRFNNPNSALFLSNSYYSLPSGVYFNGAFTILAWVKLLSVSNSGRLIDCGNGEGSDNVIAALSFGRTNNPFFQIYRDSGTQNSQVAAISLSLDQWYHLAYVIDAINHTSYIYINGVVQLTNNDSWVPLDVVRTKCNFGRSNWFPGDEDANAYFDEIKFYNIDLSQSQILQDMNQLPF
jgi:hypothetical protein